MKKIILKIIIAVFVISCSKNQEKQETQKTQQNQQNILQTTYRETDFYFRLPLYNGGEIDLKNFAGKPILVMFFTENCPYCQKAAPYIEKIHNKYSQKGLTVVGISVKSDIEDAKNFAREFNLTFNVAYNGREVAKRYGISGVPFIYLLNKDHTLNKVWPGYDKSYETSIDETISRIL